MPRKPGLRCKGLRTRVESGFEEKTNSFPRPTLRTVDRSPTDRGHACRAGHFCAVRPPHWTNANPARVHADLLHPGFLLTVWSGDLSPVSSSQSTRCTQGDSLARPALVCGAHRFYEQHQQSLLLLFLLLDHRGVVQFCLLYTSDAADERSSVDLGGRR